MVHKGTGGGVGGDGVAGLGEVGGELCPEGEGFVGALGGRAEGRWG